VENRVHYAGTHISTVMPCNNVRKIRFEFDSIRICDVFAVAASSQSAQQSIKSVADFFLPLITTLRALSNVAIMRFSAEIQTGTGAWRGFPRYNASGAESGRKLHGSARAQH